MSSTATVRLWGADAPWPCTEQLVTAWDGKGREYWYIAVRVEEAAT